MSNKELITKYKAIFDSLKFQKSLEFRLNLLRIVENQSEVSKQGEMLPRKSLQELEEDWKNLTIKAWKDLLHALGLDGSNPLTSIQSMKS